jgi:hypothetical protein
VSGFRVPRRMTGPRVEVPEWVQTFDPEAWRDDDADERMLAGLLEHGLVERYHSARDWHAANRHNKAVNVWYRQHPAEAERRLAELLRGLARP